MKLKDQRSVSVDWGWRIVDRVSVSVFSEGGRSLMEYRWIGDGITSMAVLEVRETEAEAERAVAVFGLERRGFLCAGDGERDERGRLRGGGLMGLVSVDILPSSTGGLRITSFAAWMNQIAIGDRKLTRESIWA